MDQDTITELLTPESKNHLSSAGTWARLLGVLGFVLTGFIVVMALVMILGGSFFTDFMASTGGEDLPEGMGSAGTFAGLLYLVIGAIYFLISWWIYRFGNEIKYGLTTSSPEHLTSAFNNLKNYFQAFGILSLIGVCFMLIGILGVLLIGFFK
jgi:hypothetical protein